MNPFAAQRVREHFADDHAESAAFLASYRARGGYEGACARHGIKPAPDHMPFPNHRHMGEID